ncbi:MAG: zinc-ribbon domain-containing protein [Zoogloeaceae bacterium]|jgi:predicted Zn finger-like uncharacterized protein|nr:zinc-ribbon domain-containing protein [Zoogloeaceae bacterium]
MFLTRCPHCRTIFRLNEAQLHACGGRVRCGACKQVFNAIESLLAEDAARFAHAHAATPASAPVPATARTVPPPPAPPVSQPPRAPAPEFTPTRTLFLTPDPVPEPSTPSRAPVAAPFPPATAVHQAPQHAPHQAPQRIPPAAPRLHSEPPVTHSVRPAPAAALEAQKKATPEEVRQQTLAAGLRAPRNTQELPRYSPWSSSLLDSLGEEARYPLWPFAVSAFVLALALALQSTYFYRGELGRRFAFAAQINRTLGFAVPAPRQKAHISIEEFDLKAERDPAHPEAEQSSRLRLLVTLRNEASYALAWPHLELTLSDLYGAILARKVLSPQDYLPPGSPKTFPSGNTPVRLLLDRGNLPTTSYQVDYFYP